MDNKPVFPCNIGDTIIEEHAGRQYQHVVTGFKATSNGLYLLYDEKGYIHSIHVNRAIINEKRRENNGQKKNCGTNAENVGRG